MLTYIKISDQLIPGHFCPFLSIAEFINRRLESGENVTKGALQAAIDKTSINASFDVTFANIASDGVKSAGPPSLDLDDSVSQNATDYAIRNIADAEGH